jgi:hypothetical protein
LNDLLNAWEVNHKAAPVQGKSSVVVLWCLQFTLVLCSGAGLDYCSWLSGFVQLAPDAEFGSVIE